MKICLVLDAQHFQENIFLIHKSTDRLGKNTRALIARKWRKVWIRTGSNQIGCSLHEHWRKKNYILRQTASIGLI